MKIDIISIFCDYFSILNLGLLGKAQEKGLLTIKTHDLRQWTHDVHHSVDDTPLGGGAGMVMKPEVWGECLDTIYAQSSDTTSERVLLFPNPAAPPFTEKDAQALAQKPHLLFGCGRYEGIDARVPEYYRLHGEDVREYSIGDYVLNGGETAVCVMIEAITRLLPHFMGNPDSIVHESYTGEPLLEYPQYTRPSTWRGLSAPSILTSGNHQAVDTFNREEALKKTSRLRPDLINTLSCSSLSPHDKDILRSLGWDITQEHPRKDTKEKRERKGSSSHMTQ